MYAWKHHLFIRANDRLSEHEGLSLSMKHLPRRILTVTGLILVVLFVALLAMWFPDVMVPGLLAGIAVTLGLGLVVVMRRLRRIYRQLRALNETVKRNHKRSSVWDWRLNERLTKGGIPELVDPSLEHILASRFWQCCQRWFISLCYWLAGRRRLSDPPSLEKPSVRLRSPGYRCLFCRLLSGGEPWKV